MKISELIKLLEQLPTETNVHEVFFDAGILGLHGKELKNDCFFFCHKADEEMDIDPLDTTNPEHIEKLKERLK